MPSVLYLGLNQIENTNFSQRPLLQSFNVVLFNIAAYISNAKCTKKCLEIQTAVQCAYIRINGGILTPVTCCVGNVPAMATLMLPQHAVYGREMNRRWPLGFRSSASDFVSTILLA